MTLCALALLSFNIAVAQNNFEVLIQDGKTQQPLIGAQIVLTGQLIGGSSDDKGVVRLSKVPNGEQSFTVSYLGYQEQEFSITFPNRQKQPKVVELLPSSEDFDVIIIEATRSNRSVPDLPTRTEVLTEEIDEAASMEPGKISHLITHSTGIQVQTTSAGSNGAVVRIQGLHGRYTQILKDGFPLYGGFSGSLDVMQIPPLDLRQVEYIKGSASTLYGGGAIGGLINLLTKKSDKKETLIHLNASHIGSKDVNFFVARNEGKFGFTNLASFHHFTAYDPDNDGYSDIPQVVKFNLNPKFFYNPNDKTQIYLGLTASMEDRTGGEMKSIGLDENSRTSTTFLDDQRSNRLTTQFQFKRYLGNAKTLTLKNSVSRFDREMNTSGTLVPLPFSSFQGVQLNTFSELNLNVNKFRHNLNLGLNLYSDKFTEKGIRYNGRDQSSITAGIFANHLWDVTSKLSLESGLRTDLVNAKSGQTESNNNVFVLPRVNALYKLTKAWSVRLGGGMGYRMPTLFSEEAEPLGYVGIQPISYARTKAEKSYGGNVDFKYRSQLGFENVLLSLNQMFFYNYIPDPIQLQRNPSDSADYFYQNIEGGLTSRGFESQIKLTVHKITWFLGYTYTDASITDDNVFLQLGTSSLPLTPVHSIKGDLLFVEDNKWRIGWDYEYKSTQVLSTGRKTRSLFTTGIIVERTINNLVIFLNAENFTDVRQTKYESLLTQPYNSPQFTEVWAPLDGFFFNAGLKIRL